MAQDDMFNKRLSEDGTLYIYRGNSLIATIQDVTNESADMLADDVLTEFGLITEDYFTRKDQGT